MAPPIVGVEVTPGTLFYMRHWVIGGEKLSVATYRVLDGQLWWVPDPVVVTGVTARSFCILIDGTPVAVRGVPEVRTEAPARLVVELATELPTAAGGADAGAPPVRSVRRASVVFSDLVKKLADGWEMIDATIEKA